MKKEIWKDIPGWKGIYIVSNIANIKSLKFGKVKLMNPSRVAKKYKEIYLCKDGKNKRVLVHRIVLSAFKGLDLYNSKIQGLHRCEKLDKHGFLDNSLDNLFIGTQKDNMIDRVKKGRHSNGMLGKFGKNNPNAKKVNQYTKELIFIKTWDCIKDIKTELGIHSQSISAVCRGKLNTTGGFIWKYKNNG